MNDHFMGVMSQKGARALVHIMYIMYIRIYFLLFYYIVYFVLLFIVKLNCPQAAETEKYLCLQD